MASPLDSASPCTTAGLRHHPGPFPQVQFVATGGIHAGNAQSFLDAGVRAVAVGSAFADPQEIRRLASLSVMEDKRP